MDAALAASMDCMGGEPPPPLTGLIVPASPELQPCEDSAVALPSVKGSKRRTEERHHSAPKNLVEGDEKGDKSRHGTRRSRRSSHEAPRWPSVEVPEAPSTSFPSSPLSTTSAHSLVRGGKQMLPPLAVPRHVRPVVHGGLDDRLPSPARPLSKGLLDPARPPSKGLLKVNRQDELPHLSRRFPDTRLVPPTAVVQGGCRPSEEIIDLDETENWSKGAAPVRQTSNAAPNSPNPTQLTQLGFARPMTRSDPGVGGSQPLRCPTAPKPGTAGASGSAFRAAVALSLS